MQICCHSNMKVSPFSILQDFQFHLLNQQNALAEVSGTKLKPENDTNGIYHEWMD